MIFDTHTHLNVEQFEGEEADVIKRAKELGVTRFAIVGFDTPTIEKALHPFVRDKVLPFGFV